MKMKPYRSPLYLLPLAICLGACNIQYDGFPDHGGEPMVYGALSSTDNSFVVLQEINGFEKNFEADKFISKATVSVHSSKSGEVVANLAEENSGYYYLDTSLSRLVESESYWVHILLPDGQEIRSEIVTIPKSIEVTNVSLDSNLVEIAHQQPFRIHFDCPDIDPYLVVDYHSKKSTRPGSDARTIVPEFEGAFIHPCQAKTPQELPTHHGWFYTDSDLSRYLEKFDFFSIQVFTISEQLYRFKENLSPVDLLEGGDEYFDPILLYSNLQGAFGVIGAYESSEYILK